MATGPCKTTAALVPIGIMTHAVMDKSVESKFRREAGLTKGSGGVLPKKPTTSTRRTSTKPYHDQ